MRWQACAILPAMIAVILPMSIAMPGCAARVEPDLARELAALPYPADAQRGPDLDIIARTDGDDLHLINREARSYRGMQLWLNRQYVRRVDVVAIGHDNHWTLESFIDRFQEPFPIGGLLTPEDREPAVLAELYDPDADVRYPLVAEPRRD